MLVRFIGKRNMTFVVGERSITLRPGQILNIKNPKRFKNIKGRELFEVVDTPDDRLKRMERWLRELVKQARQHGWTVEI